MPLPYQGSDDNALALVVELREIDVVLPQGNTRVAINAAAAAAGVTLTSNGADRHSIDELYDALAAAPIACSFVTPYTMAQNGGLLEGFVNWPYFNGATPEMGFTVAYPSNDNGAFAAIPANFIGGDGRIPVGDGLMLVGELAMDMPAQPTGGLLRVAATISTPDQSHFAVVQVLRNNVNESLVSATNGVDTVSEDGAAGAGALVDWRLGFYVNADGQLGYCINGGALKLLATPVFAADAELVIVVEGGNSTDGLVPGDVRIRLITNPALMAMTPECEVAP